MTPEEKTQLAAAEQIIRNLLGAPQAAVSPPAAWVCPIHGGSKVVPAGFSAKTGRAYPAFVACPEPFCPQRPPRANGPVALQNLAKPAQMPEVAPEPTGGLTELP